MEACRCMRKLKATGLTNAKLPRFQPHTMSPNLNNLLSTLRCLESFDNEISLHLCNIQCIDNVIGTNMSIGGEGRKHSQRGPLDQNFVR
jgi:hypothetical protein